MSLVESSGRAFPTVASTKEDSGPLLSLLVLPRREKGLFRAYNPSRDGKSASSGHADGRRASSGHAARPVTGEGPLPGTLTGEGLLPGVRTAP